MGRVAVVVVVEEGRPTGVHCVAAVEASERASERVVEGGTEEGGSS